MVPIAELLLTCFRGAGSSGGDKDGADTDSAAASDGSAAAGAAGGGVATPLSATEMTVLWESGVLEIDWRPLDALYRPEGALPVCHRFLSALLSAAAPMAADLRLSVVLDMQRRSAELGCPTPAVFSKVISRLLEQQTDARQLQVRLWANLPRNSLHALLLLQLRTCLLAWSHCYRSLPDASGPSMQPNN